MILKEKTLQNAKSKTAIAGQEQEKNVAFYLRRAFKDHEQVFVINDFKFSFNDETAQIDHLIVYPFGFILIESKSITGEVKVNELGEWSRSYQGKWSGMPSPIKQLELQEKLLRELLHKNRAKIIGKLFGIGQQTFGKRCWDNVCAISSNAIVDRTSIPKKISKSLVKSEFLADKLTSIMNLKNSIIQTITLDSRPAFSQSELESITSYLLSYIEQKDKPLGQDKEVNGIDDTERAVAEEISNQEITNPRLKCKECHEEKDYTPQYGRYGYFIKCNKCDTNTSMNSSCYSCKSKHTKVSKKKEVYTLLCNDCGDSHQLVP